jgi:flagellar motility protein MotE (MotC chaperone)
MTSRTAVRIFLGGTLAFCSLAASPAAALDEAKPKAAPDPGVDANAVTHYCADLAPAAQQAQVAWQLKRLEELDKQLKQRIGDLEKSEAAAKDWVARRDAMLKAASDGVVAIYAKMDPEAAAVQLGAADETLAAAILVKLKPGAASVILNAMDPAQAARLTSVIAAPPPDGQKS